MANSSVEQSFYRPGMYELIKTSSLHGKGKKPKKPKKPAHIHVSLHGKSEPHHKDVYGHGRGHSAGHSGAQRGRH